MALGDGVLDKVMPPSEGLAAALERARLLVERGHLSEVLTILDELEAEANGMPIASRFSDTEKVFGGDGSRALTNGVRPDWIDLTEAEYKRRSLLMAITQLRNHVTDAIQKLRDIVIDIEATKTE